MVDPATLKAAFQQFRSDPFQYFPVKVRYIRAAQIRKLLADPDRITVADFNQEVWPLEYDTRLRGVSIKGQLLGDLQHDEVRLRDLEQALESGDLKLHGNYIWGSATQIFSPMVKDESSKSSALAAGLKILNDRLLNPIDKANHLIDEIKGFGVNVATGLTMIYHPNDFALTNKPSCTVMQKLGYEINPENPDLARFLAIAKEVRDLVNARDFIELDYFLYLISQGRIVINGTNSFNPTTKAVRQPSVWWVNQNDSFMDDFENGLLASSKARNATMLRQLKINDIVYSYQTGFVVAISKVIDSPHSTSENENMIQIPDYVKSKNKNHWIRVKYVRLQEKVPRQDIPFDWRKMEKGTFDINGNIKRGSFLSQLSKKFLTIDNPYIQAALKQLMDDAIEPLVTADQPEVDEVQPQIKPTLQDLAELTHHSFESLGEIEELLLGKQQLIFEGPPGVGKTYIADLFARYFTGNALAGEHDACVQIVQFHQSYSYEDFIQGIRPVTNDHGQLEYQVRDGIFKRFCDVARHNPDQRFVLIIDEINRGNISRIFGELLLLLEYRAGHHVTLPYASPNDAPFTIPANVYLIGTMNSADRSLAQIDYALRRRFNFYRLAPISDGQAPILQRWLASNGATDGTSQKILQVFVALNLLLEQHLGEDYQIGHSYFMQQALLTNADAALIRLWERAVMPLLIEYFYNQRNRSQSLQQFKLGSLLKVLEPVRVGELPL